jgi:glycosyltransferase involved in cell wall biosynthesis
VALNLGVAQCAAGHSVILGGRWDTSAADELRDCVAGVKGGDGLEIVTWTGRLVAAARLACGQAPDVETMVRQSDVVHIHAIWEPVFCAVSALARHYGVPYVVSPHGSLATWSTRQKRIKKRLAYRCGFRQMLQGAGCIHALNSYEEGQLRRLGFDRVSVVPNGVFVPDEVGEIARHGDEYFVYLGRLHPSKGLDLLLRGYAGFVREAGPVARLRIVGPDSGMLEELIELGEKLGIREYVEFTGPLYGSAKIAVLQGALALCLLSEHETFSVAALEALACGTPCILSRQANFPEVESAGVGVLIDRCSSDVTRALVALRRQMTDVPERIRSACRGMIRERYEWANVGAGMENVYRALM